MPKRKRPWIELQLRTLAEHCWGEIEHVLGYKPGKPVAIGVKRHLEILSAQLQAIDSHFDVLYHEVSRAQSEARYDDSDSLTSENLPAVLNDIGTGCALRDIDSLLELLASRGISHVAVLRQVASTRNLDLIRNVITNEKRRPASNYELIAGLAAVRGTQVHAEAVEAVRTQMAFLKAWERVRDKIGGSPDAG